MSLHLIKTHTPEEAAELRLWQEIGEAIDAAYPDFLERVKKDALTPVVSAYEHRIRTLEQQMAQLALMQVVQGQQVIIDLLGALLKEKK